MMGCSILGCKSRSEQKINEITFHSFPANCEIKTKWVMATGRTDWKPTKYTKICSVHFDTNCFVHKKKVVLLKPNSVPVNTCAYSVEDGVPSKNQSNDDVLCSSCEESINGCVYTCVQCAYIICATCDTGGAHAHHYVLRAPRDRPMEEVQSVRDTVSKVLSTLLGQYNELQANMADATAAHTEFVIKKEELEIEDHDPLLVQPPATRIDCDSGYSHAPKPGTSQPNMWTFKTEVAEPIIKNEIEVEETSIRIKIDNDPDGEESGSSWSKLDVAVKSEPAEYEIYTKEEAIVPSKRKRKGAHDTDDLAEKNLF